MNKSLNVLTLRNRKINKELVESIKSTDLKHCNELSYGNGNSQDNKDSVNKDNLENSINLAYENSFIVDKINDNINNVFEEFDNSDNLNSSYEDKQIDIEDLQKDIVLQLNKMSLEGDANAWTIVTTLKSNLFNIKLFRKFCNFYYFR